MPGTRHEPAAAAPARVATVRGWRDLRALEPALHTLYRAAGIPVTARLAWWRAALMADRDTVPLLLALPGPGGTLMAATLVALRDQDGECRITSVRPHTDDVWDVAAVSPGARHTVLAALIRYAARLSCPWRLTLTGLRDGDEATWLAGQLPDGAVVPAPPVPGIGFGFGQAEVPLGPGIRSGLDRSGHRIRQHALTETIRFEREPGRLADMRDEIEAVHLARDHDAGRVSDLDDGAGVAFWRSVYDGHAARGELEVATLRLDGHLAAYVVALADSPVYRVFDGRFAPKWRLYSPGRRLEVAVVEHARQRSFRELDWMSSVAPEKLVASTHSDPRWAVTAAGDARPALPAGGGSVVSMAAAP
jgi:hypothetical protein